MDYYGYLAVTVPVRRLAWVAAARAWRSAWGQLRPQVNPPTREAVLAAFQALRVDELPDRLAARVPGPFGFSSSPGVRAAATTLSRFLPEERALAIEAAESVLRREIRISGKVSVLVSGERAVPLARPGYRSIDWEVDPATGAAAPDPKIPWVVGRLEEVVRLAAAAALTVEDDPSFSAACGHEAIDRILDLWSAPRGAQWTCPMEVALRAVNLAIALRLLAGQRIWEGRGEALLEIFRALAFHVSQVEARLENTVAVPNNHLVANLVGILVVAALHPKIPGVKAAARRMRPLLSRELLAQTLPDGMSFEGSVAYHRLAVELFLLGEMSASALGMPLEAEARKRLSLMFFATRELLDGRGLAPQVGDNDSGRALPFRARHPQEQSYLLPIGAVRFAKSGLHLGRPGAELVWLLGASSFRRLQGMPRARPPRDSKLDHGGVYLLRSKRWSCAIACGPNGTGGTGTHGHNDKLSVEVCLDGNLLIGDPGTGSYTGDPSLRNWLRGTAAHSTVCVGGQEQQPLPQGRLFALPETASARCLDFESGVWRSSFVGEHGGYERLPEKVTHRRQVVLDRAWELLLVVDHLFGNGSVDAESRFLIPAGARLRTISEEERLRVRRWREKATFSSQVAELGPLGAPLAVLIPLSSQGAPRLERGTYSSGYGETSDAPHVCFPMVGKLPMVFEMVVVPLVGMAGMAGMGGHKGEGVKP